MPKPEAAPATVLTKSLVVSVVSHGHGALVRRLLVQMARLNSCTVARVVLTQNLAEPQPEPPPAGWPFRLDVVCNAAPRGFGENHNRALANASEPFVCVLNPDVVLLAGTDPFAALVHSAALPGAGCAYPEQVDMRGQRQDSEREWPAPLALLRRRLLRRRDGRVDWVNAACLVLRLETWRALQGFDTKYFMYCEDVDLCLRLRLAGFSLVRAPVAVEHAGARASHRKWRHFAWHVGALARLWTSPVYYKGRHLHGPARAAPE